MGLTAAGYGHRGAHSDGKLVSALPSTEEKRFFFVGIQRVSFQQFHGRRYLPGRTPESILAVGC